MTRHGLLLLWGILAVACAVPGAQAWTDPRSDELVRRAVAIKPSPSELKWQQIPWVTNLTEGLHLAQEEQRPIFLWVTGDDPLERC